MYNVVGFRPGSVKRQIGWKQQMRGCVHVLWSKDDLFTDCDSLQT